MGVYCTICPKNWYFPLVFVEIFFPIPKSFKGTKQLSFIHKFATVLLHEQKLHVCYLPCPDFDVSYSMILYVHLGARICDCVTIYPACHTTLCEKSRTHQPI